MAFAWRIDTRARVKLKSLKSTENFCKYYLTLWQNC